LKKKKGRGKDRNRQGRENEDKMPLFPSGGKEKKKGKRREDKIDRKLN